MCLWLCKCLIGVWGYLYEKGYDDCWCGVVFGIDVGLGGMLDVEWSCCGKGLWFWYDVYGVWFVLLVLKYGIVWYL